MRIEKTTNVQKVAEIIQTNKNEKRTVDQIKTQLKLLKVIMFLGYIENKEVGCGILVYNSQYNFWTLDGYRDEIIKTPFKNSIKMGKFIALYGFKHLNIDEIYTFHPFSEAEITILCRHIGFKISFTYEYNGVCYLWLVLKRATLATDNGKE
jgi:hypothetical protein